MSIQQPQEIHAAIVHEVQSSMALRMALITTIAVVVVGFGGYYMGVGKTLRQANDNAKAAALSQPPVTETFTPPPTISQQQPDIIKKLPAPPPLPNR